MKISILGTGIVGRTHAAKLADLGHQIIMGTQDVQKTMTNDKSDQMGNQPFGAWYTEHPGIELQTLAQAAATGELILNALKGEVALDALKNLTTELNGKTLIDITNPLDFSKGMPPSLFISNTDSLGEQIQAVLPQVKVVKAFNTLSVYLQVDPKKLAGGDHHLFISGNDADSKSKVIEIAKSYGWTNIIDMGDITNARGMEMLLPMWLRLWGTLKTPIFNYKIVRE